jgi:glutamate carboxypeptidase
MTNFIDTAKLADIYSFFAKRQSETLDFICKLVETESPSGDAEGSRAVACLLEKAARDISSVNSIERIQSTGYGEHLCIRAFGNRDDYNSKNTLILGHTDTVHSRGTLGAQQGVREKDGRLYGPGIFDMKASCVIAVEVLNCLTALEIRPPHPVTLLLTCDEETGSKTGRQLVETEARRAAQVLVLEPPVPGGCAKTARKGVGMWKVKAQGIAAHAGLNPEAGASAILELARQTERFHSMTDATVGTNFNVGVMGGGTRVNVVAERAEMEIEARFGTIKEAERIEGLMDKLQPFDERVRLTVNGGVNRPPLERTPDVVRLYHQARKIASQLGFDLEERSVGGASDGNFVAALNVPVLDGLGVDGDGAHAVHEHIVITDIVRRGALLAALVASL